MGIVIDLLLVAIYAFTILLAAKKGFILTLFDLLGSIIAFAVAFQLAAPLSVAIYDQFVSERMVALLLDKLPAAITSPETVFDPQLFLNVLPSSVVSLIDQLHLFGNGGIGAAIGSVVNVNNIEQRIIAPVATVVIRMICFVVLGIVLLIVVKILARVISGLVNYTPLKKVNTVLGAVLGAVRGLFVVVILCVALVVVGTFAAESAFGTAVEGSAICGVVSSLLFG
ncbi:MAG: CvpA family protein [Oscillospiraceae bacterium]|jgi:uncharacterized membrane protein required for colicin V production|nr:CvpA family protein [Oscillospiraceae bacterium]